MNKKYTIKIDFSKLPMEIVSSIAKYVVPVFPPQFVKDFVDEHNNMAIRFPGDKRMFIDRLKNEINNVPLNRVVKFEYELMNSQLLIYTLDSGSTIKKRNSLSTASSIELLAFGPAMVSYIPNLEILVLNDPQDLTIFKDFKMPKRLHTIQINNNHFKRCHHFYLCILKKNINSDNYLRVVICRKNSKKEYII